MDEISTPPDLSTQDQGSQLHAQQQQQQQESHVDGAATAETAAMYDTIDDDVGGTTPVRNYTFIDGYETRCSRQPCMRLFRRTFNVNERL